MSARLLIVGVLLLVATGCRKPATSAANEPKGAIKVEVAADAGETSTPARLDELTQAVRKYAAEQQRVPKSLAEVVDAGYLSSAPVPPAGKKFVINKNLQVSLAP